MKTKRLSAILTLKDKNFSTNMKKAGKGVNTFNKKVKYSSNQVKKFSKTCTTNFKSVAKSVAGLAGAYVGFQAIGSYMSSSLDAARSQIEAETKLQAVLKNTPGIADNAYKNLIKYTDAQEKLGVVEADVQIAGLQQLATYQLQEDSLKTLTVGMNDLLAQQKGLNATQGDAVNVGNMVGKVMSGQVGALSRAGIIFDEAQEKVLKYGTEQEKAATLAQVLQQNVGGVNKALLETDDGAIKQTKIIWGEWQEEIGKKTLKSLGKMAKWFNKNLPSIQKNIKKIKDKAMPVFNTIKDIGVIAFTKIKDTLTNLKSWGIETWDKIKQKVEENQPTIEGVKGVLNDIVGVAINLKDKMFNAFEESKPTLLWLKDNALPAVTDGLFTVVDGATKVYNFIKDNWSTLEPIVLGVAGAFATFKLIMFSVNIVTTAWNVIAGIGTAVTTAFGAAIAFVTSPIGLIVLAIGALIAIGVALYKNWDTVKEKALMLWEGMKETFGNVKDFFADMWNGVKEGAINAFDSLKEKFNNFKDFIKDMTKKIANFYIGPLNKIIDGLNSIQFDVPEWVPLIGGKKFGFNIPSIPEFALGTSYFKGGVARINERGGEIVNLPNGSQVIPADKSEKIIEKAGSGPTVIFHIYADGKSVDEIMNEVVPKLKLAVANM